MKRFVFLLLLIAFFGNVSGQQTEDSVKACIDKMFLAMKNSDGKTLQTCFADSAILQTIAESKDGSLRVRNESISAFASSVANSIRNTLDERIRFDLVKVDGNLAIAWVPYSFYYKGNFSHCGVNSFQLVRTGGLWKIQYIIDTRRTSGCL